MTSRAVKPSLYENSADICKIRRTNRTFLSVFIFFLTHSNVKKLVEQWGVMIIIQSSILTNDANLTFLALWIVLDYLIFWGKILNACWFKVTPYPKNEYSAAKFLLKKDQLSQHKLGGKSPWERMNFFCWQSYLSHDNKMKYFLVKLDHLNIKVHLSIILSLLFLKVKKLVITKYCKAWIPQVWMF